MLDGRLALLKKSAALLFLSSILVYIHTITHSLALLADVVLTLTDAVVIFSLFLGIEIMIDKHRRLIEVADILIIPLLLFLILADIVILLLIPAGGIVRAPELVLTAEMFYVMLLFYLYTDFREEAIAYNTKALTFLAKDIERNILGSFGVMVAALFSLTGIHTIDKIIAFSIALYTLLRLINILARSLLTFTKKGNEEVQNKAIDIVNQLGVVIESIRITNAGPFTAVEITAKTTHPNEFKWKIEEIIRRKLEASLPVIVDVRVE